VPQPLFTQFSQISQNLPLYNVTPKFPGLYPRFSPPGPQTLVELQFSRIPPLPAIPPVKVCPSAKKVSRPPKPPLRVKCKPAKFEPREATLRQFFETRLFFPTAPCFVQLQSGGTAPGPIPGVKSFRQQTQWPNSPAQTGPTKSPEGDHGQAREECKFSPNWKF